MPTSEQLNQYYSTHFCQTLYCSNDCCAGHVLPPEQDLENGNELVFVIKPPYWHNCMTTPCGLCLCRTIDVHSVTKDGRVTVTSHGICTDSDSEIYTDIAGASFRGVQWNTKEQAAVSMYFIDSANRSHHSLHLFPYAYEKDKQADIKEAINIFLRHKRQQYGISWSGLVWPVFDYEVGTVVYET
eukprot:gb/GECG01011234.1/.p1 GENE.gb/GECG01011234.1/~~gb/GECG01011234.1/.p1  ORF type:complete len:185 (+),score=10.00 gb/GECG01011234.1/:1-555(+)